MSRPNGDGIQSMADKKLKYWNPRPVLRYSAVATQALAIDADPEVVAGREMLEPTTASPSSP